MHREIVEGMAVVDAWHKGYGDLPGACAPEATQPCNGPDIARLVEEGNRYVQEEFPEMDFITKCTANALLLFAKSSRRRRRRSCDVR